MENQDLKTNLEKLLMETHTLKICLLFPLKGQHSPNKARTFMSKRRGSKERNKRGFISNYPSGMTVKILSCP